MNDVHFGEFVARTSNKRLQAYSDSPECDI